MTQRHPNMSLIVNVNKPLPPTPTLDLTLANSRLRNIAQDNDNQLNIGEFPLHGQGSLHSDSAPSPTQRPNQSIINDGDSALTAPVFETSGHGPYVKTQLQRSAESMGNLGPIVEDELKSVQYQNVAERPITFHPQTPLIDLHSYRKPKRSSIRRLFQLIYGQVNEAALKAPTKRIHPPRPARPPPHLCPSPSYGSMNLLEIMRSDDIDDGKEGCDGYGGKPSHRSCPSPIIRLHDNAYKVSIARDTAQEKKTSFVRHYDTYGNTKPRFGDREGEIEQVVSGRPDPDSKFSHINRTADHPVSTQAQLQRGVCAGGDGLPIEWQPNPQIANTSGENSHSITHKPRVREVDFIPVAASRCAFTRCELPTVDCGGHSDANLQVALIADPVETESQVLSNKFDSASSIKLFDSIRGRYKDEDTKGHVWHKYERVRAISCNLREQYQHDWEVSQVRKLDQTSTADTSHSACNPYQTDEKSKRTRAEDYEHQQNICAKIAVQMPALCDHSTAVFQESEHFTKSMEQAQLCMRDKRESLFCYSIGSEADLCHLNTETTLPVALQTSNSPRSLDGNDMKEVHSPRNGSTLPGISRHYSPISASPFSMDHQTCFFSSSTMSPRLAESPVSEADEWAYSPPSSRSPSPLFPMPLTLSSARMMAASAGTLKPLEGPASDDNCGDAQSSSGNIHRVHVDFGGTVSFGTLPSEPHIRTRSTSSAIGYTSSTIPFQANRHVSKTTPSVSAFPEPSLLYPSSASPPPLPLRSPLRSQPPAPTLAPGRSSVDKF